MISFEPCKFHGSLMESFNRIFMTFFMGFPWGLPHENSLNLGHEKCVKNPENLVNNEILRGFNFIVIYDTCM